MNSPVNEKLGLAVVPQLRDLATFESLPLADRVVLEQTGTCLDVSVGESVINEGARHDALLVILSGRFEVTREGVALAQLGPGQLCGEMEMLNPPHSMASVTALEPSVIWKITREQLRNYMETHPEAGGKCMKLLAKTFADRL